MLIEDGQEKKVYGKTGSSTNGEAWFIGFTEKGQQREYFAIYLEDSLQKERVSSSLAKEIALKIIE
jgi:beta-lactamase class D